MGKISRQDSKLHGQAMALINSDKVLTQEEVEFCYENYNPMAEHDIGKNAVFFTPPELAWDFAVVSQPNGPTIDLCAGIGILAWNVLKHQEAGYGGLTNADPRIRSDLERMVCVELNPEFVRIGKRLLPQAEWYCADIFDKDFLKGLGGEFLYAISNPPYGKVASNGGWSWLKTKTMPMQWKVMEIAVRLAYAGGMFIIPKSDCPVIYEPSPIDRKYSQPSWARNHKINEDSLFEKFLNLFPGLNLYPASLDTSVYKNQWKGASPDVLVMDLVTDNVPWERPWGMENEPRKIEMKQLSFV
jgi:hypothetical protein